MSSRRSVAFLASSIAVASLALILLEPRSLTAAVPLTANTTVDFTNGLANGTPVESHYRAEGLIFAGAAANFEFAVAPPSVPMPNGLNAVRMNATTGVINFTGKISEVSLKCSSVEDITVEVFPLPDAQGASIYTDTIASTGSLNTFVETMHNWTGQFGCSVQLTRGALDDILIDEIQFCEEEGFPVEQLPVFNSTVISCTTSAEALGVGEGCSNCEYGGSDVGTNLTMDFGTSEGVLLHSGQEVREETDLLLSGRDGHVPFRIMRRHTTRRNIQNSIFGEAWAFNYAHTFTQETDDLSLTFDGFGRVDSFEHKGGDIWEGTRGRFDRAMWDGVSSLVVRRPSGLELVFDTEGDAALGTLIGHLTALRSPNGNEIALDYENTGPLLERKILTMTESYGREITFTYGDGIHSINDNRCTKISDFSGREVVYTYDASGYLVSVRSPVVASTGGVNDFPNGKTTEYEYLRATDPRLSHALTAVIYPNEVAAGGIKPARLSWTYEQSVTSVFFGFVKTHSIGNTSTGSSTLDAGGVFTYSYELLPVAGAPTTNDAVIRTTVVDRRNTTSKLELNILGQTLKEVIEEQVPSIRSTPQGPFTRTFTYTEDGRLNSAKRPLGGELVISYPAGGSRLSQGNQIERTYIPDSRSQPQSPITIKRIHEPVFNRPWQVVDPRGVEGGNEAAFTTEYIFDYMEDLPGNLFQLASDLGMSTTALNAEFALAGVVDVGADVNGDGVQDQTCGNVIQIKHPTVTLPTQASPGIVSSLTQVATEQFQFNSFGQQTSHVDPEENTHTRAYNGADDPDGDGVIDVVGASSTEGGYISVRAQDTKNAPLTTRNNGSGAPKVLKRTLFSYTANPLGISGIPANPRGVPTMVTDARGVGRVYLVNELDQIVKSIHAASVPAGEGLSTLSYETIVLYDSNNNVIETRLQNKDNLAGDNDFIVSKMTYDILDNKRSLVDDEGHLSIRTEFEYDASLNLIKRIDGVGVAADSSTTEWLHDERNLLVHEILGVGGVETGEASKVEHDIDLNGNFVLYTDAEGADTATASYDGFDRQVEFVDREGNRREWTYDASFNMVSVSAFGPVDPDPLVNTEVLLARDDFEYDERNRRFRSDSHIFHYAGFESGVIDGGALDLGGSLNLVSSLSVFDRNGRTIGVIDPDADVFTHEYDGAGRIVRSVDPKGNLTETAYDGHDNALQLTETEKSDLGGPDEVYVSQFTYDALGRLVTAKEPNLQTTSYEYDSRRNLTRTTDHLGNQVEYRHDRLNRLVDERRYLSSTGLGATASNVDLSQGGGDGIVTLEQTWDSLHRLKTRTDDNGNVSTYTWDDLGRQIQCDYQDQTTETWEYNRDGEMLEHVDQVGNVSAWTYDSKGRATQVDVSPANASVIGSTQRKWVYDGLDRVWQHFDNNTDRGGDEVTVTFYLDSLGRRILEEQRIPGKGKRITRMEYQGANRLVSQKYPETPTNTTSRKVVRTYDSLDRLSEVREGSLGGALILKKEYIGPYREIRCEYGNGSILDKSSGGYDSNRRSLRHEWTKSDGTTQITAFVNTYNGTNRRLSEEREHLSNTDSYTFDSAYRMTAFSRQGALLGAGSVLSTRDLDGADKMTAFVDETVDRMPEVDNYLDGMMMPNPLENGLNQYSSFDSNSRTYNKNGSLHNDGGGFVMRYDSQNRLVTVTDGGTRAGLYLYDAEGRRVARLFGVDEYTRYMYAGDWRVLEEEDEKLAGQETLRQYVDGSGIDEHIQLKDYTPVGSDPEYYYHCNSQGFVGALSDAAGDVVEYYEYSWLGEMDVIDSDKTTDLLGVSKVGNPYGFQGRRYDPESGLYLFRYRYYDPATGEFRTIDPSGMWRHGQGNGYSAFAEDPWNNGDPMGLGFETIWDAACVIYDGGKIVYGYCTDDEELVEEGWTDLALDAGAMLIPGVPAGLQKLRHADEVVDAAKALDKATDTAKAADKAADGAKAADNAKDAAKAADEAGGAAKAGDSAGTGSTGGSGGNGTTGGSGGGSTPQGNTPSPALEGSPYSPGEVSKRQSQTRRERGLDPDPKTEIPDSGAGKSSKGSKRCKKDNKDKHPTGERNVGRNEHSRVAKGTGGTGRVKQ